MLQGDVTPIVYVQRSATAVKVSQEWFSALTVDYHQNFIGPLTLFRYIFMHYFIRVALTVYQKHLTIVLHFETALSIDLLFDRGRRS